MATARQFEDLHVWQDARGLVNQVYLLAKQSTFRRDPVLRNQITRAAASTMSNIAEGFERASRNEFIHALNIAKGSNAEVRSQLYLALDQQYIDAASFEKIREAALALSRRLSKFIDYLEGLPANSRRRARRER